jgi:hypothetical protein
MHNRLNSENPTLQEDGVAKLKQIAARLADEENRAVREKVGSDRGAEKKREIGKRTAAKVAAATTRGRDPLGLVSERHERRIRQRLK